jgi:hypothetical protein
VFCPFVTFVSFCSNSIPAARGTTPHPVAKLYIAQIQQQDQVSPHQFPIN